MTSKGSPLGRADLHHARLLRPSKPSWRTGVLRNKLDRPSVQMSLLLFGQVTLTRRRGALGHANLCRGGPHHRYSPRTGFVRDTGCGGGVRPPYPTTIYYYAMWT